MNPVKIQSSRNRQQIQNRKKKLMLETENDLKKGFNYGGD